jgi:ribosomal protein S18 acetylase RimI-like enzyme
MTTIRPLDTNDVDAVVARITNQLAHDAASQPLLRATIDAVMMAQALRDAAPRTWIAEQDSGVVGHLYGAILENETYGHGVWIGPDGASFDTTDILADLYAVAGASWIEHGALEHYVWVIDDVASTQPWYELGFARMHMRGVLALDQPRVHELPEGYRIRRGGVDDLDIAVALDDELDAVQMAGPSFSIGLSHTGKREELFETLDDPEVHHYVVEYDASAVAQCITFPLPPRRGSFDHTLHLSAVTVHADHRHLGVATAMVDGALRDATAAGFEYVETNWRVTNRRARNYWLRYGFAPTYVRLHRTIGTG